ncbi:MAG: STM4011 family radical SAM protein [bacterium]|nr:STM4011 family radical SAM protein [bacterium]
MGQICVQYRGSLKSCNYTCAYCPFSKKHVSKTELERDKAALFRFYDSLKEGKRQVNALQIVPYGEAMIHPYYWEFLADVSKLKQIQAVGIQTNLSLQADVFLRDWEQWQGKTEKLRLWATFHPSMTKLETFVHTCTVLHKAGVEVCVGVVGVPEQMEILWNCKRALPAGVPFWVNAMEGMGRAYSEAECLEFQKMDVHFLLELKHWRAEPKKCQNRYFVEADGTVHGCNISREVLGNWYQDEPLSACACRRRMCSCYLAYSGRSDFGRYADFGAFPMFRIPESMEKIAEKSIENS